MRSFRLKIVISLIGLSLISYALGGYHARSILLESFETVVMASTARGFVRDVSDYYRAHGSWERAHAVESFDAYRQRMQLPEPPPPPDGGRERPGFLTVDRTGRVWVEVAPRETTGRVGDMVTESELQGTFPIRIDGEIVGSVVPVGEMLPTEIEDQYLRALTNTWWISLLLVAAVAIPIGIFLGRRLTDPINRLIQAIGAMGPTTMRQKVPVRSTDELGLLSQSFNQMSDDMADFVQVIKSQREQIVETESMLRQGLVNISHELRTPLNTSVFQAQAMLDGVRELDHTQMEKLAKSLDYLSRLVNDLHQLSLADIKALHYEADRIDLAALVRDCLAAQEAEFRERKFTVSTTIPNELILHGDTIRLRQIIENLFSNCVRYSDQGAELQIGLSLRDDFAEIVVADSGPGVPADSLGLLFDRFYRVDTSRSRATGGTGLGLSIVKTCAEIHGGTAHAYRSKIGGLEIRVRIPVTNFADDGHYTS